jgi:hypothetical protein
VDALIEFNLAPLTARRDMAMLGLIHRTIIGRGPSHLKEQFRRESSGNLFDPKKTIGGELLKRSALGLVAIYNLLPEMSKRHKTVKLLQGSLQQILKERASEGCKDWWNTFSPIYVSM